MVTCSGAWLCQDAQEVDREVGAGHTQAVAEDEDEDVTDAGQVSLRLQPARSQSYLAGAPTAVNIFHCIDDYSSNHLMNSECIS